MDHQEMLENLGWLAPGESQDWRERLGLLGLMDLRGRRAIWVRRELRGREASLDSRGRKDHQETPDSQVLEALKVNLGR